MVVGLSKIFLDLDGHAKSVGIVQFVDKVSCRLLIQLSVMAHVSFFFFFCLPFNAFIIVLFIFFFNRKGLNCCCEYDLDLSVSYTQTHC